ncbi:hypothetical protein D3C77_651470 [compost metagenome]
MSSGKMPVTMYSLTSSSFKRSGILKRFRAASRIRSVFTVVRTLPLAHAFSSSSFQSPGCILSRMQSSTNTPVSMPSGSS